MALAQGRRLLEGRRTQQACPATRPVVSKHAVLCPIRRCSSGRAGCADVRARAAEVTTPTVSQGDVYVVDPKPLQEGEEKHIISIFVADEAGLINRVAGVFARRGANIESLAVGLTVDKALFTIVVTGKAATVANLVKQLGKIVKVRYVEDITRTNRIEREMILLKIRVAAGMQRAEVLQLAQIFRARVVDVADETLTICATGDPGKLTALIKVMAKFGIAEIARTGRICLKRGEKLLEEHVEMSEEPESVPLPNAASNGSPAKPAIQRMASRPRTADVYAVDTEDAQGVWDVENVLEATYTDQVPSGFRPYTLNIEVQDVPGVLNQVTQVFARRGYNVQSLAVGPSEREGMSRICMVVPGKVTAQDGSSGISPLLKQLSKLVFVQNITDLTDIPFVNRELLLVKVSCLASQRGEVRDLASIFRGSIVDVGPQSVTIEVLGKEDKMKAFTDLLEPYGILEIARTGRVALARESGVNSDYLEKMSMGRVW